MIKIIIKKAKGKKMLMTENIGNKYLEKKIKNQ